MTDVFKFHTTSADAAPGKGNGETLVSPISTYAELRKVTNWRRQLATGDYSSLPLTGKAELWEALPRKPHVRRTDLEELRFKGNIPEQADTMEAPSKSSKKPRSKKATASSKEQEENTNVVEEAGSNARATAPAVWVQNVPEMETEFAPPDMDEKEESNTLHFCPVCRNYLFAQIEKSLENTSEQILIRLCRNCGYKQTDVKSGLISEIIVGERSAESYKILLNEFTAEDPRLPHLHGTIKCPDPACPSHNATSDIIYMKYDQVNLNFLYICYVCKFTWHSTR